MCSSFVYIVSSPDFATLRMDITTDLVQAAWALRQDRKCVAGDISPGEKLVWFAEFASLEEAQAELDKIKAWPLAWQKRLVEAENSDWRDLWSELTGQPVIRIAPEFGSASNEEQQSRYPVLRLAQETSRQNLKANEKVPAILIRQRA